MKSAPPFFAGAIRASLPLWVWALHFSFSYVSVAVGCRAGWQLGTLAGLAPLRWLLVLGSIVALPAAALLLISAMRSVAAEDGLTACVRLLAAVMALLGIVWASVPVLLLPLCRLA